jgi:hypothetical protein
MGKIVSNKKKVSRNNQKIQKQKQQGIILKTINKGNQIHWGYKNLLQYVVADDFLEEGPEERIKEL